MELALVDNECQSCYVLKSVSVVTLMHSFMLRVPFSHFEVLMVSNYLCIPEFTIEQKQFIVCLFTCS